MPYSTYRKRRYPSFRRRKVYGSRRTKYYKSSYGRKRVTFKKRRIPNVQPGAMSAKLHYYDHFDFASGIADFAVRTFRLNSIFDPDYTGVGGNPSGYLEYAALYNKYRVMGCKILIRFEANPSMPSSLVGFRIRWNESAPGSGVAVQQTLTELNNQTRYKYLPATGATVNTSQAVQWCSMYVSMRKMYGPGYKDEDFESLFGQNPYQPCFLDVMICGVAGTENSLSCKYDVRLTYYCKFTDKAIQFGD